MVEKSTKSVRIDLNQFKLQLYLKPEVELTLHFDSPSRRFYLSVIALVVHEMKKRGRITSIPLEGYLDVLVLLNQTVGGAAGSSKKQHLLPRIYRKWKDALPDLENAPLFKVIGRKKKYDESVDRVYCFNEGEKDSWANLFEYKGSHEQVRLRFSIDRLGASLDDVSIVYGEYLEQAKGDAWKGFIAHLRAKDVAPIVKTAFPLPDKPSIAVLPFRNLSNDPNQDFFCDGLTEEIITGISKIPKIFVIARNSTFTYKGKDVRVQQVSEELGVRYVLEGSVQKADNRVKIAAQLIDAFKGHHIWSELYDRELKDIFAIQDEITIKILSGLRFKLTEKEKAQALEKYTDNLQAYLKILEGMGYMQELKFGEASKSFEEARTLDQQCATAYAWEGEAHVQNYWFGPDSTRVQSLEKAFESGKKCAALDDKLASCNMVLCAVYLLRREYDKAICEGNRAVKAYPNSADAAMIFGLTLRSVGKHEESLRELERALRLDPLRPADTLANLGATYLAMGRNEEATATFKKTVELHPNSLPAYLGLAVVYSSEGRMDEARLAAAQIMKIQPNFSAKHYAEMLPYKDEAYKDFILKGLIEAGLK